MILRRVSLLLILLLTCCGYLGDPGNEPTGWENLPIAGVAPYVKIDIDQDASNSSQPFITLPQTQGGSAIRPVIGNEPCVVRIGDQYLMWYEDDGRIFSIESTDGEHWQGRPSGEDPNNPTEVIWEDPSPYGTGAWEKGYVGAPSVLLDRSDLEAPYKMWYSGGDPKHTRIGLALSIDGIFWKRTGPEGNFSPVVVPCLTWEGGRSGSIGSPAVILDDDIYRMWYDGGGDKKDPEVIQRIGYAYSGNGRTWFKADGKGDFTPGNTCTLAQEMMSLDPLLTPNPITPCTEEELAADPQCHDWSLKRNWEWQQVWSPYVMRDDSSQRRIYRMYYTGGFLVLRDIRNFFTLIDTHSTSVGYAGSLDGIDWVKQRIGINPVVDEPFALDLGGSMEYYCQTIPPQGENIFCSLRDLLTEFSLRILTNEYAPTVLRDEKEFKMWFRQNDLLNIILTGLQGVGLATNPPRNIFGTGP